MRVEQLKASASIGLLRAHLGGGQCYQQDAWGEKTQPGEKAQEKPENLISPPGTPGLWCGLSCPHLL